MKTIPIADLIKEHSQEKVAKMVGCHQTNLSLAIRKNRKIYVSVNDAGEVTNCYEIKNFPNPCKSKKP